MSLALEAVRLREGAFNILCFRRVRFSRSKSHKVLIMENFPKFSGSTRPSFRELSPTLRVSTSFLRFARVTNTSPRGDYLTSTGHNI
jgi:hypothetical protein